MIDIKKIRSDFPILKKNSITYLDNASTTQKPIQVIDKITQFYENYNSNVHRGVYELAEMATLEYEEARNETANFINCSSNEVIFTGGTTDSINMIANLLSDNLFSKGDEIIITEMEHHSNIVPWQIIAEKKKLLLKFIPVSKTGELEIDKFPGLINEKTKLVAFTHMSNILGTINPIEDILSIAKNNNILTLIDGAQSVSHLNIDVKELDCDFFVFSGHKIFGPTGVGVLYGKFKHINNLSPSYGGGHMIKNVTMQKSNWADPPFKFEPGTPKIAQAIGLGEAIKYFKKNYTEKNHKYLKELRSYLLRKLTQIPGIQFLPEINNQNISLGPIIAFNIKNCHSYDLAKLISTKGICIRSGHHCTQPLLSRFEVESACRISLHIYNTKEEIDYLYDSILETIKILN